MAQHVHDPSVIERRLRPIYDLLEVGNNKKALQEADKFLKKNQDILCAKALKALALLRLGKDDDADVIIDQIAEAKPYDDPTLQIMTFCYKEQEQLEKICELYTNAAKQQPGNEDILSHLFMAHVRVSDFQSQQTVALQLYKHKPKNPYYFWAIMSIVLKAIRGPARNDPSQSKMLLLLAERMINKHISDKKLDAEQEVQLYLSILNYQEKYKEALEFIDSELGRRLYPGAPVTLKIDWYKRLGSWSELNVLLKSLLEENRDRWDYYKEYIQTVVELKKQQADNADDAAVECFETCHDFLCELIENYDKRVRGPFLGRLELHRTMTANKFNADELLGDFLELLVEYFRFFGSKPCCANDIILFLDNLEPDRRAILASRLLQVCEISATTLPRSKEQMQMHICSLQVSRICGAHALSSEHLAALYTAFSLHYEHGMTAFGIDLLPTDMGPSDSYALLAVHVMYDLSVKQQSSEHLVEALCLLHYLLCNSPSNFHAKLLCLQIYHILGCGWSAHKTYETLDIKQVQLDSLGYLHCAQLPICGMMSLSKPLYDSTLKFFTASYKESLEYWTMCYKFGSFSKLQEFMDFREKLSNSLHYSLVSAEALLLELIGMCGTAAQNINLVNGLNVVPSEDRMHWDDMTDNRDLSLIISWDPQNLNNETTSEHSSAEDSFRQDIELLRIRSMLLRIVVSTIEIVTEDNKQQSIETLTKLKLAWTEIFANIRKSNYKQISKQYLVNLLPLRLHGILSLPYDSHFQVLMRLILALEDGTESAEHVGLEFEECIKAMANHLCEIIEKHNKSTDLLWTRRSVQETIVNCIEALALTVLVTTICFERYTVLSRSGKKSKKKDEQNNKTLSDKDRLAIIVSINKRLKTDFIKCDEALATWIKPVCPDNITDRIAAMSLNPKVEILVSVTIKNGHSIAVRELRSILKEKIRMLK